MTEMRYGVARQPTIAMVTAPVICALNEKHVSCYGLAATMTLPHSIVVIIIVIPGSTLLLATLKPD